MKGEFAQVLVDRIKSIFGPTFGGALDTVYYGKIPSRGKRTYPCVLVKLGTSVDTMQTTVSPLSDVNYEIHVFGKYPATSTDESQATKGMQDATELSDAIVEALRNDTAQPGVLAAVRELCLDFRSRGTRFVPPEMNKELNDYSEASMMADCHATFNTSGGVYGYSRYGEFIYGP